MLSKRERAIFTEVFDHFQAGLVRGVRLTVDGEPVTAAEVADVHRIVSAGLLALDNLARGSEAARLSRAPHVPAFAEELPPPLPVGGHPPAWNSPEGQDARSRELMRAAPPRSVSAFLAKCDAEDARKRRTCPECATVRPWPDNGTCPECGHHAEI